jgi:hypothetical protein
MNYSKLTLEELESQFAVVGKYYTDSLILNERTKELYKNNQTNTDVKLVADICAQVYSITASKQRSLSDEINYRKLNTSNSLTTSLMVYFVEKRPGPFDYNYVHQQFKYNNNHDYDWNEWVEVINQGKRKYGFEQAFMIDSDEEATKLVDANNFMKLLNDYNKKFMVDINTATWRHNNRPDFKTDPVFVTKKEFNNNDKIAIFGDFHSSLHILFDILATLKSTFFVGNTMKLKSDHYLIFLGDLVDRGPYGVEILFIVFALKMANYNNVFILNGNHEDTETYSRYGFTKELGEQFGYKLVGDSVYGYVSDDPQYKQITHILHSLPSAMFIKYKSDSKWYQLCHGGIHYNYKTQNTYNPETYLSNSANYEVVPDTLPSSNGLKWSDFNNTFKNSLAFDARGKNTGINAGPGFTKDYLKRNNLHSIISGHQDNVNLGLLIDDDCNKVRVKIGSTLFSCPETQKKTYDLYGPDMLIRNRKKIKFTNHPLIDVGPIKLNPKKDFLALVTSSATVPKQLDYGCYLIMENK